LSKLALTGDEISILILEIDKNTDGVLTLDEWESVLAPKVESKHAFAGIMKGLNITDPIELEEKILDLRYRTSWLRSEVSMLRQIHADAVGETQHQKDKRREQGKKAPSANNKLIGEIKHLEQKVLLQKE